MEKINFKNGQAPALNATNLNQLQTNVENAINSVVESGSNDNGNYIKYSDGTMICYHSILKSNVAFNKNTSGTYYFINENYEHLYDWTYPQQFIGVPKVITTVSSSGYVNACCGNITRTEARVLSTTNYNASINITFNIVAIGKWK